MPRRATTIRDHHRKAIARVKPPCAICGQPIDYRLKYPDPLSFVVDHIVPFSRGGVDTLANKQPAHNLCNQQKYNKHDGGAEQVHMFVTARTW